jgi:hypothetical protein
MLPPFFGLSLHEIPPHLKITILTFTSFHLSLHIRFCDLFVGSPTALADPQVEKEIREASHQHGCYIPAGALWGAEDLAKMNMRKTLHKLTVTMKKHPSGMKLNGELKSKLEAYIESSEENECVLYEGSVRELCPLAPNNVNTMACAAIAASDLGFDGVCGRLVADKKLTAHVITIDAQGKPPADGSQPFSVFTTRLNFFCYLFLLFSHFSFLISHFSFLISHFSFLISLYPHTSSCIDTTQLLPEK